MNVQEVVMCRYPDCVYVKEGNCFNASIRNGLPSLPCVGKDRCQGYKVKRRIDNIGQNGNDGEHYLVEKVARIIC